MCTILITMVCFTLTRSRIYFHGFAKLVPNWMGALCGPNILGTVGKTAGPLFRMSYQNKKVSATMSVLVGACLEAAMLRAP
mmetsp:Transcript_130195/g.236585  ORF Transcript_130195/g.236585 Transcript_130195/m.236585 type:complete len:81 (-) Transcript_130195:1244-1486(-)